MPTSAPTNGGERGLYDPRDEHDACGMGFVAHARGERSHTLVRQALELLHNLSHRSAVGDDPRTGDGAGVLLQLPHAHLRRVCQPLGIALPEAGTYGVGMLFLAGDEGARGASRRVVEAEVAAHGWRVLGWRDVPVDDSALGRRARETRPAIVQLFVAPGGVDREVSDASALERGLYLLRKRIERAFATPEHCYVATLSSRTVVYKGMLRPDQLGGFYPDLADPELTSAIALVHSRFSTNTFPSWRLAHPYRFLCHNGEINTLRGNLTWMRVREEQIASERLGDAAALAPIIAPAQSDSASLDNALELLVQGGRPLTHAMSMLVPEAWMGDPSMSPERAAFYDYHAGLMEPWDGPAALAFTDGRQVGAVLDRNGLRPARWLVTNDDLVVLASEAGALPIAAADVRAKGRLRPGQMILVNTVQGRVVYDEELRAELASLRPYRRWIAEQRATLGAVPDDAVPPAAAGAPLARLQRAYGYTREELAMILAPMATSGEEPVGSMGTDTPLAVLSERPQLLFSYFKQLFAQVTNPPIDPIRERLVMSLRVLLGPQGNLLDEHPEHARQLALDGPVLTARAMAALRAVAEPSLRPVTIPARFAATGAPGALAAGLDELCAAAAGAARAGRGVVIISDRFPSRGWAAIPSLLAVAAVHHHLIREGLRSRVGLVVESGEAREVSHFALLAAYGAGAVHPWLALDTVAELARADAHDPAAAQAKYVKSVEKGLLKILSKMGISTLQSYCGAQLFEAVGLSRELADRHFTGTASRIGGIGLDEIAAESLARHAAGFEGGDALLDAGGEYHHRARGEEHAWAPMTIATLQRATRDDSFATFRDFSRLADASAARGTIRGMLDFVYADEARDGSAPMSEAPRVPGPLDQSEPSAATRRLPVPLDEVEPAASIARRFVTGAMSFGSISREAHETIAMAMNRIGGRSNTGEGGEDPARFGTDRNSAIKQVASARFGVTTEYLVNAAELQIKIAQGAKPGEGGQLPGHKVDAVIARTRHSTAGVTLISPPPHHDIYSIEDLKQLIFDLKNVNPSATVSVKLVAEAGVGTVAAGVAKAHADLIVISGDSGGTGASPLSSIKRAGAPWELGLAEAQQTLVANGLRGRVRLQTDGQLKTGRDVVIAALLGAEEFGFATAPLVVEGCVMMRKCHLNTCPVGIATQDPVLRAKFAGTPEQLVRYFMFVAEEVRELMARLGFRTVDEIVGRSDVLRRRADAAHAKAATLDFGALLHAPASRNGADAARRRVAAQEHGLDSVLDHRLIAVAGPALERGEQVTIALPVSNVDRSIGTMLSGEIARRRGDAGLAAGTIVVRCTGSAGQSFGAFGARGLSLELEGEANDYVGKGLSGARIVVRPPRGARFLPDETVIVGNTVLYGATSGEAYFAGLAGERFAVRNSGAIAVVEGVGDHGCEYMTGGTVIVLGRTGRNFAAGMSGGIAFVLDESTEGSLEARCNRELVELGPVTTSGDRALLRHHVEQHARLTGSPRARHLLGRWDDALRHFVRVIPVEYRRALEKQGGEVGGGRKEGASYG